MKLQIVEDSDVKIVEGAPNEPFMSRPEDAAQIIEACFSSGARIALLYADNLTDGFFDLSSGEAGAILAQPRLAVRGGSGGEHRDSRGAPRARRDD